MYFKGGDDPNQQNIKSYLPAELQHTAPKKAATPVAGAPMGPPLYTVSGQLAGRSRLDGSAEGGEGSSTSLMVEVAAPEVQDKFSSYCWYLKSQSLLDT